MFYNTYRATKAAMRDADKSLPLASRKNINPKERLMNLQKRRKLKDLLITKFTEKYGLQCPQTSIEEEITNFVQKEKINDVDLQRLDAKINKMLRTSSARNILKTNLSNTLQGIKPPQNLKQNINKNEIDENKEIIDQKNTILPPVKKLTPCLSDPHLKINNQNKFSKNYYKNFKTPEEELAELEEELAKENIIKKNNYTRLDFTNEGDEWDAISKYNKKLFDQQIIDERIKDNEMKRRTKEDLDFQIKQKIIREKENELKEKEYDKVFQEHLKNIDEIERQKNEKIKQQIAREKINRDNLLKDEYTRKKLEKLKQKKFECELVKNIKKEIENERKNALEKKRKENQELNKAIKENEKNQELIRQQKIKEKEEDMRACEEQKKTELKQDLERKFYFDRIKNYGNRYKMVNADEIVKKMKEDKKLEDEKMQFYYDEKRKAEDEREEKEILKKNQEKKELKKYLDMQIEEKKKEELFLKELDNEQARIWNIDCKKYYEDEKLIKNKIRDMNIKNLNSLKQQIKENTVKNAKKKPMTSSEYAMNRNLLEKAKASLSS